MPDRTAHAVIHPDRQNPDVGDLAAYAADLRAHEDGTAALASIPLGRVTGRHEGDTCLTVAWSPDIADEYPELVLAGRHGIPARELCAMILASDGVGGVSYPVQFSPEPLIRNYSRHPVPVTLRLELDDTDMSSALYDLAYGTDDDPAAIGRLAAKDDEALNKLVRHHLERWGLSVIARGSELHKLHRDLSAPRATARMGEVLRLMERVYGRPTTQ